MSTGEVAFNLAYLLGPSGGIIGIAFGAGAAAGWGFYGRTMGRIIHKRLEEQAEVYSKQIAKLEADAELRDRECNRRIDSLYTQLNELRERYTHGLERTIAQMRDSVEHMVGRLEDGRFKRFDE